MEADVDKKIAFMKGNEALAEAALRAGMTGYFGYPITPQTEVIEYLCKEAPKYPKFTVLQAESEVSSINMVYGAAAAGGRIMTTTSSPGFSLMQEGISYIACADIPCVIANVQRGGPGLGTIQPSQGDYFQSVKGGGHGDYKLIVFAPNSVQEVVDYTYNAFDLATKWMCPVLILSDGAIGQMMEKVILPEPIPARTAEEMRDEKPWATNGKGKRTKRNIITSLNIQSDAMERRNNELQEKYHKIEGEEVRYETYKADDAEILITAYGLSSRVCKKAVDIAREEGLKLGLVRPITLWPFPTKVIDEFASKPNVKFFMDVEMNVGQMIEDVKLVVNGRKPVYFYGRTGGILATAEEILEQIKAKM